MLEAEQQMLLREMITHIVAFDEAPAFLSALVERRPDFIQVVFKVAD